MALEVTKPAWRRNLLGGGLANPRDEKALAAQPLVIFANRIEMSFFTANSSIVANDPARDSTGLTGYHFFLTDLVKDGPILPLITE